jgi:hypothetical protein
MGGRTRSSVTRCRIAVCVVLALPLAGCAANVLNVIMFGAVIVEAEHGSPSSSEPALEPSRRVHEQDCSKPMEDPAANLKCR